MLSLHSSTSTLYSNLNNIQQETLMTPSSLRIHLLANLLPKSFRSTKKKLRTCMSQDTQMRMDNLKAGTILGQNKKLVRIFYEHTQLLCLQDICIKWDRSIRRLESLLLESISQQTECLEMRLQTQLIWQNFIKLRVLLLEKVLDFLS